MYALHLLDAPGAHYNVGRACIPNIAGKTVRERSAVRW